MRWIKPGFVRLHSQSPCMIPGVCLAALLVLVACGNGDETPEVDTSAYKIVLVHAEGALVSLSEEQADEIALKRFLETTSDAATRSDLTAAWVAIPDLKALGEDFLEENVFRRAETDGDWPTDGPADEKSSYVMGTRDAIAAFLEERESS